MPVELRFDTNGVDWQEAATIFERAPLGTRAPDKLERCFKITAISSASHGMMMYWWA
ncbi:MAG: hypothetical protein OCC46_03915 [Pseudodesulfovibrio sp.]